MHSGPPADHFENQMVDRPVSGTGDVELARLFLSISEEFSERSSSLLKNLEIESFRILAGRSVVVGAARVELDVIF